MPAGRPSLYKPEFCEEVIRLGVEGKGRAQIAAVLDVTRDTLDNWAADHPEFLRAMTRARELALAWWEEQGQKGIWAKEFNANAYRLQVLNRFPAEWRDKQDHEHKHDLSDPLKAMMQRIAENGRKIHDRGD